MSKAEMMFDAQDRAIRVGDRVVFTSGGPYGDNCTLRFGVVTKCGDRLDPKASPHSLVEQGVPKMVPTVTVRPDDGQRHATISRSDRILVLG